MRAARFVTLCTVCFFMVLFCAFVVKPLAAPMHEANRPTLMVGIPLNTPPVAFLNEAGEVRGLGVDLATMLGTLLKKDIRFVQDSPEALRRRLRAGTLDFISSLTQPSETADDIHLLVTPFALNRHILVGMPEVHITCEQDYPSRTIAHIENDPYAKIISDAGGIPVPVVSYMDGLERLVNGTVEAFVAESGEVASYIAQRNNMHTVRIMGLSLERKPLSIEVRQADSELLAGLTSALVRLENEAYLDTLRDKWLGRNLTANESFWNKYKQQILSTLGVIATLVVVVGIWIFTLRRQISRTSRRLQNSERRYRELIEASPDMTLLIDQEGKITLANRIARETLNIRAGTEAGSLALWNALCEQGRSCLGLLLEDARTNNSVRSEITLHPDQEDMRQLEFIAFPSGDTSNGMPLICCIGRDITDRRRLEQELVQVERLAVIGKMAASVAHEINNPLGIIMANTDVALDLSSDPTLKQLLAAIQRNVERAATTTKRLLNIAMPQSINQLPQNLTGIIQESLAFLAPRMKAVELDTTALVAELPILGDRILLEQLFINLLLNALGSMEVEGKPTGSLTLRGTIIPEKHILYIELQDSGCGIPPENLQRVFDPFFTTRGSQGFGLGLFIASRIVEAHEGSLTATSQTRQTSPNSPHGTTMHLEFPVCGDRAEDCPGDEEE